MNYYNVANTNCRKEQRTMKVNLLKSRMLELDVSVNEMCNLLEITRTGWYRRLHNNTFSTNELKIVKEKLKFSPRDIDNIFLS